MRTYNFLVSASLLAASIPALATIFATLHGVVHDPQHRPLAGARIVLQATDSDFSLSTSTNADGEFELSQAPIGTYKLSVSSSGFETISQPITLTSGTNPIVHVALPVASTTETVVIEGSQAQVDTVTPTTLISRQMIDETPGASRTIGMEMITDYVPGAYMTHDMLHMRGGHQTSWLIDGVAIPNTKIASNVGPQIDPKDIDQLETQRGSYAADVGDRTYGVFNVLPRNGFERNRDGELLLTAGNLYTGEAQLSLGDHSAKTAWYASLTGSRSNYGLATPVAAIYHDATNSAERLRLPASATRLPRTSCASTRNTARTTSRFPTTPTPTTGNRPAGYYSSYGLRDGQTERDSFVIANWVHTLSPKALFSVAPFYHFNQADYDSPPLRTTRSPPPGIRPRITRAARPTCTSIVGPNSFSAGLYSFYQAENDLFGVIVNDQSYSANTVPNTTSTANAGLVEFYLSDHLQSGRYVTLLGGMRFSSYHGGFTESAAYPRIGATVEIPRLHWVLRGFYGHFFQPAPRRNRLQLRPRITPASQPGREHLHAPALRARRGAPVRHSDSLQGLAPRRGQLQESRQQLPRPLQPRRIEHVLPHRRRWSAGPRLGNDSALAAAGALRPIPSRPTPTRSPSSAATSSAASPAAIPTDPACDLGPDYTPVDHDQRHTLNTGFTANLPLHTWFATNVYYGSGFPNGLAGARPRPLQRPLSARPHHLRRLRGPRARRALEALGQRAQRHQPPRPARQLHHHRRLPLQRSEDVLRPSCATVSTSDAFARKNYPPILEDPLVEGLTGCIESALEVLLPGNASPSNVTAMRSRNSLLKEIRI